MIIGTGIDIIEVERVGKAMERSAFFERVFTQDEREYIVSQGISGAMSAAGIFAAKEAVVKALSTGFVGMRVTDIEILRDGRGKPYAQLYNGALAVMNSMNGKTIHISISHTRGLAVAQAILEG